MAGQRVRNIFDPKSDSPYRLSRTRIWNYIKCPRCFYIDRRLGISQPGTPPFTLNNAVDELLKKEFDVHRVSGTKHPLMQTYGVDAIPYAHDMMDDWRESLTKGVQYLHEPTNLLITGGVDDVWINSDGELIVVDYKATSKVGEVNLDADWQVSYKRQMELYQWLFRQNGFKVNNTGYFVYCNGDLDKKAFDGKLEFNVKLIPYTGSDDWVEKTIYKIKECLMSDQIPVETEGCEFCKYNKAIQQIA